MSEKPDIHMQNNETGPLCFRIQKINLKWVEDLNVRPKTLKLLRENRKTLLHISLGNDFVLAVTPEAQVTKAKII